MMIPCHKKCFLLSFLMSYGGCLCLRVTLLYQRHQSTRGHVHSFGFLLKLGATLLQPFCQILLTDRHLKLTLTASVTCCRDSWVREMVEKAPLHQYHDHFKWSKIQPHLSLLGIEIVLGPSQVTDWIGSHRNGVVSRSHSPWDPSSSLGIIVLPSFLTFWAGKEQIHLRIKISPLYLEFNCPLALISLIGLFQRERQQWVIFTKYWLCNLKPSPLLHRDLSLWEFPVGRKLSFCGLALL